MTQDNNSILPKKFNPQDIEAYWAPEWERRGLSIPTFDTTKKDFSIHLPPPNITGTLHMGHAFNQTVIDILVRYYRMCKYNTLWIPGTDHAGIATQILIERKLDAIGKSRHEFGRDEFIKEIWKWKERSGSIICQQIRRLGSSVDWSREYFTMDANISQAVIEVFVQLYEQGLIYRGKRLVNWDPKLLTAISDIEVTSEEEETNLWYVRYPLIGQGGGDITIATTRPETIFGDVAIMVHPEDMRYKKLIGKYAILPLCNRQIPIISDFSVNPDFGTGAVKVTPAHDFNDYNVGKRYNLPQIQVLTLNARINNNAPIAYRGLYRYEARQKVASDLEKIGRLEKVERHRSSILRGDRTGIEVEPMLTDQWFIAMNKPSPNNIFNPGYSISQIAMEAVRTGKITFIPNKWTSVYYKWLENIQDWCISRQLWWGHQVPAWYDNEGNIYVARNEEEAIIKARAAGFGGSLRRDEDVLDTWFSSALIPFSSLGWPKKSLEINHFLPSSVLVTGFDIIFFWVVRMVMMTKYFTGKVPFEQVYIHGLVRDAEGQKMSKSKGNTFDPIDIIDGIEIENLVAKRVKGLTNPKQVELIEQKTRKEFPNGINGTGADALRFTFASMANLNRNINFDLARCEGYRNFCNKLWNATRFVLINCKDYNVTMHRKCIDFQIPIYERYLSFPNLWIVSLLQHVQDEIHKGFKEFRFDNIANTLYHFIWEEYCDWYVEFAKVQLQIGSAIQRSETKWTLIYVLEIILRLAHPVIPFITESLWQRIAPLAGIHIKNIPHDSLMVQTYPNSMSEKINLESEIWINELKSIIGACRNLRSQINAPASKRLPLLATGDCVRLKEFVPYLCALVHLSEVSILENENILDVHASNAPIAATGCYKLAFEIKVDILEEKTRLNREIKRIEEKISQVHCKLANKLFVERASPTIVKKEQIRLSEYEIILHKLVAQMKRLTKLS